MITNYSSFKQLFYTFKQKFYHYVNKTVLLKESHLLKLAKETEYHLDRIEEFPIRFVANQKYPQIINFETIMEKTNLIIKKLIVFSTPKAQKQRKCLKYKLLALKYRLEDINEGIDPSPVQQSLVNILKKIVRDWKSSHPLNSQNDAISERDLLEIMMTSQYPEFIHILIEDKKIRDDYMTWTFRDGNSAQLFIEYPALQKRIVDSNLSGRTGRLKQAQLKIVKKPVFIEDTLVYEKIVTLPFEGIDENILDPTTKIYFKGDLVLNIDQIFKVFKNKNFDVGNLEYLALGITNWNSHRWGYWNEREKKYICIDLSHHQWWKQLPLFEIISQDEAVNRYGKRLNGKDWCISAAATRGSATLDYENTHAFFEIAIPWGNQKYAIYDFGKFATQYPNNFFECLSLFCHNLHATVAYPDENIFYSHRQQAYQSFVTSPELGNQLMSLLKTDMNKSKNKNLVYQIESDNCAKWVHHHLEVILGNSNVPDMFKLHLLDTEPVGIVAMIFKLIKKLPIKIQTRVMTLFHLPLGATKKTWIFEGGKKICKSLTRHEFWQTGVVYLPALLVLKKEKGLLNEINAKFRNICGYVISKFPVLKNLLPHPFVKDLNFRQIQYTNTT